MDFNDALATAGAVSCVLGGVVRCSRPVGCGNYESSNYLERMVAESDGGRSRATGHRACGHSVDFGISNCDLVCIPCRKRLEEKCRTSNTRRRSFSKPYAR